MKPTLFLFFALALTIPAAFAQGLQERIDNHRLQASPARAQGKLTLGPAPSASAPDANGPRWVVLAQIIPAPAPENPTPQKNPAVPVSETQNKAKTKRDVTIHTSVRYGYDKQQLLLTTPGPFLADVRRQIRTLVVTAQVPLSDRTSLALSVPYISQTTRVNGPTGTFKQRGNGVGDIGVFLERRFPEIARGTEVALTLGMLMPTGKDPFNLGDTELPTGLGFYQPLARVRISKMRVPMQFYTAFDYGTSLARDVNGTRRKLPNSFGVEAGFYYNISPEFTAQTSVQWSQISSPYTFETDSHVAYLSQSLSYNHGPDSSLEAGVDVGLTDDAVDFFLSLAYAKRF
jgi:hypothetical protein